MSTAATPLRDAASSWLKREIEAGRLSPTVDDSQLVAIAGVLLQRSESTNRTPKKEVGRVSDATSTASY